MNPQLAFKLGHLLGAMKDFLERVEEEHVAQSDIDRIRSLSDDVAKKFFLSIESEETNERKASV